MLQRRGCKRLHSGRAMASTVRHVSARMSRPHLIRLAPDGSVLRYSPCVVGHAGEAAEIAAEFFADDLCAVLRRMGGTAVTSEEANGEPALRVRASTL